MKMYSFYSKVDNKKEKHSTIPHVSRLQAAKYFAERKGLPLKSFLIIYSVSR